MLVRKTAASAGAIQLLFACSLDTSQHLADHSLVQSAGRQPPASAAVVEDKVIALQTYEHGRSGVRDLGPGMLSSLGREPARGDERC